MAEPQRSKDTTPQTRIIAHMNADHQDSMIRYLQHHHHVSALSARNASLTSIDLSSFTITTSSLPFVPQTYQIPIIPPLESWAEARARFVTMDKEACAGLGYSSVAIRRYIPPHGLMIINFMLCLWTFVTFSRRAHFLPGSLYHQYIFRHMPPFANFCSWIQPLLIGLMMVIHLGEAIYLERSRLRRHTVKMLSRVWWMWVVSDLIEGWPATIRFDRLVKEEEARKAKQKH